MIRKHSITLHGHRTSFSLEEPFLEELRQMAERRQMSLAALIAEVDSHRGTRANLSSALRLHVYADLKAKVASAPTDTAKANIEPSSRREDLQSD